MSSTTRRPGPPDGKRATNRRRRTNEIATAALPLLLEQGVESVTIDAICGAAGIAKGSFYRYFDDKIALVEHLLQPLSDELHAVIDDTEQALRDARDVERLEQAYQLLAARVSEALLSRTDVVQLYLQESRAPGVGARAPIAELGEAVGAGAIRLTIAARSHGLLRDVDPAVSALAVVGAIERLLAEALAGRLKAEPLAAARDLLTIVLDGVRLRE